MDMEMDTDMGTIFCFGSNQKETETRPVLVLLRSSPRDYKKLKINTLLCNGHGHGKAVFLLFRMVFDRNKRLVSDSAETSFRSSFGYFETKLVS